MFCRESSVRIQCQPDADSQCNTRGKRKALVSPFSGVSRNPAARLNAATARIIRGAGRQNRLKNFRQGGCLKRPAPGHQCCLNASPPAAVTANASKYPGPFNSWSADKIHPVAESHAESKIQMIAKTMMTFGSF